MGGFQGIPLKLFLSQSAETNCRVALQCFRKVQCGKEFLEKRWRFCFFPVEIFFLTVPRKNSLGNPSVFQKNFRNFSCIGVGGHHVFLEKFLFRRMENFCNRSLLFQSFSGADKILCVTDGGRIPFFRRKKRVSKNFMHPNFVGKNLWMTNGGYYFSPSKILVSQWRKISREDLSIFQKVRGFEKIHE